MHRTTQPKLDCHSQTGSFLASCQAESDVKLFLCPCEAESCLGQSKVIDMNVSEQTSGDMTTPGGEALPPSTGLAPDALPEVQKPVLAANSQTGVSTRNALLPKELQEARRATRTSHWYVLRCTYGRENKAYEYLARHGVETYYPTIKTVKQIDGKRKTITESRFPNLLFARSTEEIIKEFVYDNANLPYLRFYYRHYHEVARIIKEPLIVPDYQIEGMKIICASEAKDIIVTNTNVSQFQAGQTVRVTDGVFKGVIGKVARYQGQQRVAIIIDGLFTVASAYVPSAFLEVIS